ncbi:hypothetical protein COD81_15285 [Bacillus cereus]|uniref:hypothetical protein n=1 Tax=Bacillus cereus TaxID=1396 RepID=UPI000BEB5AF1|nr:hypothetical protein [Bacillus cereus]PEC81627.1 hypothetical protein CON08_00555 [Bacillus cereus]PGV06817.1 hypothetical protein COD81_15285 [Bacillus cereus]
MEYNLVPTWEEYEIAKQNGIKKSTVNQRININGWSVEDAISKPLFVSLKEKYAKQWELAQQNGISYDTFFSRIKRYNWTPDDAAKTPILSPIECTKRAHSKIDIITPSQYHTALNNGIGKCTLRTRVFVLKWDIERAITTPPNIKHRAKKEAI